jgi:hypothetical protein
MTDGVSEHRAIRRIHRRSAETPCPPFRSMPRAGTLERVEGVLPL